METAHTSSSPTSYRPHSPPQLPSLYASASSTASRQPYIPPQSSSHYNPYRSNSYPYPAEPLPAAYQPASYTPPPQRELYYAAATPGASVSRKNSLWEEHTQGQPLLIQEPQLLVQEPQSFQPSSQTAGRIPEMRGRTITEEPEEEAESLPDAPAAPTPAKRGRRPRAARGSGGNGVAAPPPSAAGANGAAGFEVKTKFPVARIKRIMQADEDVGKVAQVTPVVVSKALELFMIALITKSSSEARQRSSKRVTSLHIKQAILKDEQFDFLQEIVSNIADASAREGQDAGEEGEEGSVGGRRKRRGAGGGGRKQRKERDDS